MIKALFGLAVVSAVATLAASSALSASFDCTKATTKNEKAICADPQMSKMDEEMAKAYQSARQTFPDSQPLARSQVGWLRQMQSCFDNECLQKGYRRRLEELRGTAAAYGSPGTCIPVFNPPYLWHNWRPLGCISKSEASNYLHQSLFLRLDDEDASFMGEGTKTRTCSDYFSALAEGLSAQTTLDMNVESNFRVACGALLAIERAKSAKRSLLPNGILKDLSAIPVSIMPSIRHEDEAEIIQDAKKGRTVADYVKSRKVSIERSPPGTLSFTYDKSWDVQLSVISVGDFDDDGFDDALLEVNSHAVGGTLGWQDVWLMTRSDASSRTVRLYRLEISATRSKKGDVRTTATWKPSP